MLTKFKVSLLVLCLSFFLVDAQILINPLPKKGFEKRISEYVDKLHVVDTHEHMMLPDSLIKWTSLDFMLLFSSYSYDDMISAGLDAATYFRLAKEQMPVSEKWKIIEPFWNKAKNTAYCRNSLLIATELYNINELDVSSVEHISKKISDAYKNPDWLYQLLDKAKIDYVIQDGYWVAGGGPREFKSDKFRFVARIDDLLSIWSKSNIEKISNTKNASVNTLDEFIAIVDNILDGYVANGIVGFKTGMAYTRTIYYENTPRWKAEEVFNRLMKKTDNYSFEDVKPLQDYLMHAIIKRAGKHKIPMIFHTGLLAGNGNSGIGNTIDNVNPKNLQNLLKLYPEVNFVLYHGGYPFGGEYTMLIKNFPNAYADLSWLYLISPTYAARYLHEWLETIPASKIMAYGGDGRNGEATYGHLVIAKQVVSQVLTEKVKSGYFSETEAIDIANLIFYENAVNFYKLNK